MVSFSLPELHADKTITWPLHVDAGESTHYDMILGRDLLTHVGIDLLFSERKISWEGATIPMKDPNLFKLKSINQLETETLAQDQIEEDFIQRMTEEKYSPANLQTEVAKSDHLTQGQQQQLLRLLHHYETLFDGSLGTWRTTPIQLE